jgi:hypothetical protein
MAGQLLVHAGGIRRTREELATIAAPPATDSWKPIPHFELVSHLVEELREQDVIVRREQYCTHDRDDARLFGVLDLAVPDLDQPDFGMSLGLRGSNDKSLAISVIAAARVFVCDNMAFSGSGGAMVLKRRHTSGLDLARIIPPAIDAYLERAGAFRLDIERMKDFRLSDGRAKELIYDAFASSPVLPVRLFPVVARLYFDDDAQREKFRDRSLWSLNNAFTEAVKLLKPVPQHACGLNVGRFFGRIIHHEGRASGRSQAGDWEKAGKVWDDFRDADFVD